jgi:hypothetical protein
MEPHSHTSDSHSGDTDDHPHPKLVDFVGVFIAVLTLVFPLSTVFRYAPPAPASLSTSSEADKRTGYVEQPSPQLGQVRASRAAGQLAN